MEEKKKRGRPPLPPDLRAKKKSGVSATKEGGYVAQKKYYRANKEKILSQKKTYRDSKKGTIFEPRLRVPVFSKEKLEKLCADTGLSITHLFFSLVKEKYGVDLLTPDSNGENKSDKD